MEHVLKAARSSNAAPATGWLALGLTVLVVAWFATLGTRRLLNPDEGRYAEIAREMVVTGDWITPRLNGIKYFEKPPLQYWMTAAAYTVLGQNELAARLWSGVCGFAGLLFVWYAGTRLFGAAAGRMAAAVLGSTLLYVTIAQLNTLDTGLSFFLSAAMLSFLLAQRAPRKSNAERRWMLTAWAAAALAFLSKGLIALILPALTLLVYTAVTREYSAWKRLHWGGGLPLFLVLSAPWIIAVSLVNPEFPRFFFLHEQFERFLTPVHDRDAPWWYFLQFLALGALPWTFIAPQAIATTWRTDSVATFRTRLFLLCWIGAIVGFFSLSHSKLPPYIVPVMPALALLLGDALELLPAKTLRRHFAALAVPLLLVAAAVMLAPADIAGAKSIAVVENLRVETAAALLLAACALAGGAWLTRRHPPQTAVLTASIGVLLALSLLLYGSDALRGTRSGYDLALQIAPHVAERTKLYSVGDYDQTLPFYLRRTMTLAAFRGELEFGLSQEPALALQDIPAFAADWARQAQAVAVMTPAIHEELLNQDLPMMLIARSAKLVAVAKP